MQQDEKKYHIPVLLAEAIEYLNITPHATIIDATFGGGGHTRALLQADPTVKVIAFDWDKKALDLNGPALQAEFPERLTLVWGNFGAIGMHLKKMGIRSVQGILADLGTSFTQLTSRPGFSFATDTPLDMRMSPEHRVITAADIINRAPEDELAHIFFTYGEERHSKQVARAIVVARKKKKILTTGQLVDIITAIIPRFSRNIHPATKVFQALRIVVNKEFEELNGLLAAAPRLLAPHGRFVCITFHSLEDRIVKQALQQNPSFKVITNRVVSPSPEEIRQNPASRSAKLRAAEKVGNFD
jgi:16S rRNA (cytosine1402-N4)-methyltransferase